LFIYFRVCEKQQTISNVTRFSGVNKTELLKRCWLSLQSSITEEDHIFIVYDSVSDSTLEWLKSTANTTIELVPVEEHDWNYHLHTVTLVNLLEKKSIEYPTQLHYIVEDDYLHAPNAIRVMQDTLHKWPNFAVSYDYPDRYIKPTLCHVVIGSDRHWRTIDSCTMTILAMGYRWLDIMPELKKAAPTSNDKIFDDIFKQIPCISPMPGLSSHMTDYHLTPLQNWAAIWESQNV
jgi:hypothetical protein